MASSGELDGSTSSSSIQTCILCSKPFTNCKCNQGMLTMSARLIFMAKYHLVNVTWHIVGATRTVRENVESRVRLVARRRQSVAFILAVSDASLKELSVSTTKGVSRLVNLVNRVYLLVLQPFRASQISILEGMHS